MTMLRTKTKRYMLFIYSEFSEILSGSDNTKLGDIISE